LRELIACLHYTACRIVRADEYGSSSRPTTIGAPLSIVDRMTSPRLFAGIEPLALVAVAFALLALALSLV